MAKSKKAVYASIVGNLAIAVMKFAAHPFGHGKELYFRSLIGAVTIFGAGGGISIYEGILHLLHPTAAGRSWPSSCWRPAPTPSTRAASPDRARPGGPENAGVRQVVR